MVAPFPHLCLRQLLQRPYIGLDERETTAAGQVCKEGLRWETALSLVNIGIDEAQRAGMNKRNKWLEGHYEPG